MVNCICRLGNAELVSRGLPERSCTALVAVTMMVLLGVSPDGVKVTEVQGLEQVIPVLRRLGPSNTPKVFALTVFGLSDLENIRVITVFKPMFVDMLVGVTEMTVGEVVSTVAAVVKWKLPPWALLPT